MTDTFGSASGPKMSLIDNKSSANVGIGNYKGVMLCNRPFAGTAVTSTVVSNEKNTFTCGVVPEPVGLNVVISTKEKFRLHRSKRDNVLTKHRKWLADLQKSREEQEVKQLAEQKRKDESQKKFIENEAKMRQLARTIIDEADAKKAEDTYKPNPESRSEDFKGEEKPEFRKPPKDESKSHKKVKPAWALPGKATEADDKDFVDEADDLINFAQSLDYGKYIDDVEVMAMMDRLKRRIIELEKEVAQDELREADADERQKRKEKLTAMDNARNYINNADAKLSDADECMSNAARALLQDDEDLHNVHSVQSVTSMMRAAREKAAKFDKISNESGPLGHAVKSNVPNEPLVIIHDPNEGTRLENKQSINNLPYMHRNPAV